MPFNKASIKKQISIEDGEPVEVVDLRLQYQIPPGESYESIRSKLLKKTDERFNEVFAAELGLMPARVEEGQRWKQMGMFDPEIVAGP